MSASKAWATSLAAARSSRSIVPGCETTWPTASSVCVCFSRSCASSYSRVFSSASASWPAMAWARSCCQSWKRAGRSL